MIRKEMKKVCLKTFDIFAKKKDRTATSSVFSLMFKGLEYTWQIQLSRENGSQKSAIEFLVSHIIYKYRENILLVSRSITQYTRARSNLDMSALQTISLILFDNSISNSIMLNRCGYNIRYLFYFQLILDYFRL